MKLTDNKISEIIRQTGSNFEIDEFLKTRHNLSEKAVWELCLFRKWAGYPFFISSAWRSEGAHSVGAFDIFIFDEWQLTQPDPYELWNLATTWNFGGVGIYFDTEAFGNDAVMLHVDVLEYQNALGKQRPLRWIRNEHYYYQSLNKKDYFWSADIDEGTSLGKEIERWKGNAK